MGTSVAFGCPECGRKVRLKSRSPGRRIRCRGCGTLVEVPFFPRNVGRRRSRRPRWRRWTPIGVGMAVVVLMPVMAWRWWQGSIRADRSEAIAQAMARMDQAERLGDPSAAFLAADAALAVARESALEPPGGLDRLIRRRDELAIADVAAQLDALPDRPAREAMEQARAIAERSASDPALGTLMGRAGQALSEAARRWTDEQLGLAQSALAAGNPAEALALSDRLAGDLDRPPAAPVAAARERLRGFVAGLVRSNGILIEPIELTAGPAGSPDDSYRSALRQVIRDACVRHGYLPAPPDSPLAGLWDEAPFRFRTTLTEQYGASYLQSPHQTTLIRTELQLDRSGRTAWSNYFEARTRIPLPGLSALESSRMEIGSEVSREIEHRFARDARADLIEKLQIKLGSLPRPASR
ncbi:hypothetical protein AB1L88_18590 [Tautonia sp. JC769]|uniref:hypothetical protein n=1 Tax=Tautonia sp. JC769 TaxID=3232135 RepID=UPI003459A275